jgi:predicted peptidase
MGGAGTWYAAARYPGKFAALVPIAGAILPLGTPKRLLVSPDMLPLYDAADAYVAFARRSQLTPVWIFRGTVDQTIPVTQSRKMAEALRTLNGDVRFTEYANEGHEIAPKVYLDAELWKWLLSQRLNK